MPSNKHFAIIWKEAPFLRLVIPFMAGICFQFFLPVPALHHWLSVGFSFAMIIVYGKKFNFAHFLTQWRNGLLVNLLVFALGRMALFYHTDQPLPASLEKSLGLPHSLVARIETPLAEKPKSLKGQASVKYLLTAEGCQLFGEKILIYFRKNGVTDKIHYGTQIIFQSPLRSIEIPGNPETFDFKKYCARQHIYNQVLLDTSDFMLLPEENDGSLKTPIIEIREKVIQTIRRYIDSGEACGLLEALMIGYTNDLDKGLVRDYTNTGVVHIIAISGLHLALIYSLLQSLLQKIKDKSRGSWIKTIIIVACLWMFSFLCGGSASVLRSAVMLTLLLTGRNMTKQIAALNSLAASAFLLLCYNPWWLWDIGFQLSYSAVLSLLIFVRPLRRWFSPENKLLDLLWNAAAVSIAAQILTTPISLYYFHQFPNYFLITNLVAVPLSSLVLTGGLVVCCLSWAPFLARPAGQGLSWLINILDNYIKYMARLPFSILDNIRINFLQTALLYLIIFFSANWLLKKKPAWLFALLASTVVCLLMNFWNE